MKNCRTCRHWDNDPADGNVGECMVSFMDDAMFEVTDGEHTCKEYSVIMPEIITVASDYHERHHVVILEWDVDSGSYVSLFVSRKHWTDMTDAILEAEDRATNEMEYVSLDKFAYPCREIKLLGD